MTGSGNKVVVTGIGALTPLGVGASVLFDALLEGRTGFRPIDRWDTTDFAASARVRRDSTYEATSIGFRCLLASNAWAMS